MRDINFIKIGQSQGDYDSPEIEEKEEGNLILGKITFGDNSRFLEACGEDFKCKTSELVQKRFPNANISSSCKDTGCVTYVASSIDKKSFKRVSSLKLLKKLSFKDLGGGVYKKGNDLWSLKVDKDGNYNIIRSEAERDFGTDLENQEVVVSKRASGDIEILSRKEFDSEDRVVDNDSGLIVNSFGDKVGTLLFVIEGKK